ncbi:MAG TPA: prolyl oligopeptidase family serine peptidase [Roseiflexaceae bacterium]|nr:prolyl oligopeptidase family serine peptidase [Roseiflexaceae bacterium]
MTRIESLLAARRFLAAQLIGDRLYFISDMSGRLSLYAMDAGGSIPEPLLPPQIALQNPELVGGYPFAVFPDLGRILVMLDNDGDENYQPQLIALDGGYPMPAFGDAFARSRVVCEQVDRERGVVYLAAGSRDVANTIIYRGDLQSGALLPLAESSWGIAAEGVSDDDRRVAIVEAYTSGDHVLREWCDGGLRLRYGRPIEDRAAGEEVALNAIQSCCYTAGDRGLLFITALFEDTYSLGFLPHDSHEPVPVTVSGAIHSGLGEMVGLEHLGGNRYLLQYNIDGSSWAYEAEFDESAYTMRLGAVLCGSGQLAGGVAEAIHYDALSDRFVLTFSNAVSPTQIYTIGGVDRSEIRVHTRERALGIAAESFAAGEDASFTSYDGLRISARLYLPSATLGYRGPRPLVYYIHGGPQSQERPDFAWFSMPLIQLLTMRGCAVFVPNVRGSSGYGMQYMKHVDRDWGGADMADHVHAMQILGGDARIDTSRAGVVGRSYGGYMTLMLATRHAELWRAAVDMFGPYDLLSFLDRIPATWKPYFHIALGDPIKDREFLLERSPATAIDRLACPLLVIQGKNDPRVVEPESADLVERLRADGKQVEYLMFPNEGHDVLKFENRVTCYNAIADFFVRLLQP